MTHWTAFSYLDALATISVRENERGKMVAHALDFDLVAVGDTVEGAIDKLLTSVRVYLEYGVKHGYVDQIQFPAPDEFWPN